jgi:phospholipid transport system substrate-binding protein
MAGNMGETLENRRATEQKKRRMGCMKNFRDGAQGFLVVVSLLSPVAALAAKPSAAQPSARVWLERQAQRVRDLGERTFDEGTPQEAEWKAEATGIINESLDWNELAKRSLGRDWDGRTKKEQSAFVDLLQTMVEASYKSKFKLLSKKDAKEKKPKKATFEWKNERKDEGDTWIAAVFKADKTTVLLDFGVLSSPSKGWRVFDVSIDDVSTVRTYRSQFRKIIREEGFDGLLDRIRKKTKDIESGRADLAP